MTDQEQALWTTALDIADRMRRLAREMTIEEATREVAGKLSAFAGCRMVDEPDDLYSQC